MQQRQRAPRQEEMEQLSRWVAMQARTSRAPARAKHPRRLSTRDAWELGAAMGDLRLCASEACVLAAPRGRFEVRRCRGLQSSERV